MNGGWGSGALRTGRMPATPTWAMRRKMMSPSYTTRFDQLMRGRARQWGGVAALFVFLIKGRCDVSPVPSVPPKELLHRFHFCFVDAADIFFGQSFSLCLLPLR
ncbi:DUF4113 domain-containing protein [Pseudomonas aeruginosa]|uniref:DUF4113 domain-containing protein n=2 Tax=Pseudomonas aeruginosa TaxID=287 RepID=UPI0034590E07